MNDGLSAWCARRCALLALLCVGACADLMHHAERIGAAGGLRVGVLQGEFFAHQIFESERMAGEPLYVFVDGDGSPWTDGGSRVAADSTPRTPLALQLAARTPRSVLYLGRPCHFSVRHDPNCTPDVWTSGRYSARVVASMTTALEQYMSREGFKRAVLIGYSGGGVLAILVASHVPSVVAVVTIAGNLDTDAWTSWHGYLPLVGSLNPASVAPLPSSILQRHLSGGRDKNVPAAVNERFMERLAPEQRWDYPDYDHVCCWVEDWPVILARLERELGSLPAD